MIPDSPQARFCCDFEDVLILELLSIVFRPIIEHDQSDTVTPVDV